MKLVAEYFGAVQPALAVSICVGGGVSEEQKMDAMREGLNSLLSPGYGKTVGFLIPTAQMSGELIDWYETKHSVNASFMWPHMRLYQRNYIMNVDYGPAPQYKVVTEFVWKSEEDKRRIVALYATDAAARTVNEVLPPFIIMPFPPDGYFLAPVDGVILTTCTRHFRPDEPRHRKVLLVRRGAGQKLAAFEAATLAYAERLARTFPGAGLELDFRREEENVPAPADAVLYIDCQPGMILPEPNSGEGIVNIFDVLTLRSPIEDS